MNQNGPFWSILVHLGPPIVLWPVLSFALAMLIVDFVGVVRGFRGPKKSNVHENATYV